jgi:TonB family protein
VKKILNIILFALVLSAAGFSQTPSAADLLKDIDAQGSLWSADKPFLLQADVATQLHTTETGHVTWKWSSKELWQEETTLADFHQITVRKGDDTYTARNLKYTPLPIREIHEVFRAPLVQPDKWKIGKVRAKEHGNQECLELRSTSSGDWKREICVSSDTRQVISDETMTSTEVRRGEFSDYQPFLSSSIPRTLKLTINEVPVLTVVVTSLEERSYAANEFAPPANSIVRRTCAKMVPPKVLKDPSPTYPSSERVRQLNGTSVISVTVLPDGSVSDVYLVGSSYHDMDEVTQQIVKTWKFKPAMCGTEAVTADIQVQVNFRMR